jgi:CheY-like chemotaxis protein
VPQRARCDAGGGTLLIETANVSLRGEAVEDLPPGEWIMLKIADTGTGMPPDVLERAGLPFFTTKEVGRGTGLGLSQVRNFVHQSGGHLKIDSAPGKGTIVRAYLPRWNEAMDDRPPARELEHTILIVDDDEDVREMAVNVIEELGFNVIAAANGTEALELLQREPAVSLLFTDVVMPGLNGFELARRATRLRPELKVLYTSGFPKGTTAGEERARIVRKPYRRSELYHAIQDLLEPSADPR